MTAQNTSWRKSSHSEANGACVEVAYLGSGTAGVAGNGNLGGVS